MKILACDGILIGSPNSEKGITRCTGHAEDLDTKSLRPPENMPEVRGELEKY